MIVGELERASVELRDGGHQTEPQSHARRAPACVPTIETLGDFGFLFVGDTGTVVSDRDFNARVRPLSYLDRDRAILLRILQRVFNQVPNRLGEEQRITGNSSTARGLEKKPDPVELGNGT